MTQIITITNQKGGVGKTTVVSALVCGLHERGARVLGVDLDPQGNLGFTLGLDIGDGYTIYDVLKGNCAIEQAIAHTEYGDILSSDILLSQQLDAVKDSYDFIIIDTPPSLNILTINAYVASTGLILPMEAEVLSLVGISQIQDIIETVQKSFNPNLKVLGILLNKYNPRLTLSRDILDLAEQVAEQLNSQVFSAKVRRSVSVAMAPAYGQSVLSYKPDATSARDLQKIVSAVAGDRFPRRKKR